MNKNIRSIDRLQNNINGSFKEISLRGGNNVNNNNDNNDNNNKSILIHKNKHIK